MITSGKTKTKTSNLSMFLASMFTIALHQKDKIVELTPRQIEDYIEAGKSFTVLSVAKEKNKIIVHLI